MDDATLTARLDAIDARFDYMESVLEHVPGLNYSRWVGSGTLGSGDVPPEVVALVREGKKVQALQLYGRLTGIKGDEARAAIESVG